MQPTNGCTASAGPRRLAPEATVGGAFLRPLDEQEQQQELDRKDEGGEDDHTRRYAPACCKSRALRPILSLFLGCGGKPPEMTVRQWTVVSAVTVAGFFSHFDDDLLPLCLRQLQRDLGISEAQVCLMLSVVGMGKAGAAVISVAADVIGRRYVFFVSILIFSFLSVLSAFQHSLSGFVILQLTARIFLAGKDSMANVYLVEETDPKCRGWVMGTYSSVAVTGGGAACILFGAMGGWENGWRYLYGLASIQLLFMAPLWRLLPEKTRASEMHPYEARVPSNDELRRDALRRLTWQRRLVAALRGGMRPLRLLVTAYPKRAMACLFVNLNNGFAFTPSAVLKIKQLQDVHGLSPAQVSCVVLSSGLVALMIFPTLGRMSDTGGRRLLLCCFMSACPVGVLLFYNAPGLFYLPFYFLQMMAGFALNVLQTTFFAETFPASHRCTAQGMMMLFAVLGGVAGLACESLFYTMLGTHAASVSVVLLPAFISPIVVHCCLPETAGKDLDEIAPERADAFDEKLADEALAAGDEAVVNSRVGAAAATPQGRGVVTRKTSGAMITV